MAGYTVNAKDLPDFFRSKELARMKRVHDALFEAAEAGAAVIARAAPKDLGELCRSIRAVRVSEAESQLRIEAPHAGMVELGSRPHTPPLKPLVAWVKRHERTLSAGRRSGDSKPPRRRSFRARIRAHYRRVLRFFGGARPTSGRSPVRRPRAQLTDPQIEQIARAIQMKIAKEGTKPTHFVRQNLWHLRRIMTRMVIRALRDR